MKNSIYLSFCFVFISTFGIAQSSTDDLQALLISPANSVEYYKKLEPVSKLIEEQKWSEAESILVQLTREYPLHGTTWGQLAYTLRKQNKHAEAIRAYQKVIELQGPGQIYNARYWTAVSYAALGQTREALDTLEQLVYKEAYLQRTELLEDPNFASLKDNPRLREIAGKEDVSKLSRDDGWRRDIDYLVSELKRSNPWNAPIPERFFQLQAELKNSVPKLDDYEVVTGLGRMMNALQRGHSGLWLGAPGSKLSYRPMPIRLYIFPEGIFIIQGSNGNESLVGSQVLKFGNTTAAEALKLLTASRTSESAMENLWIGPYYLTVPAVLKGLGISPHTDRASLTLRMPDGTEVVKTVETVDPSQPNFKLVAPSGVNPPMFLKNLKEMHWFEPLPEQKAIYVQVNNIMPDEDETVAQFGLRLRKAIVESKPRNVILDIRHNNGGNSFTYPELLRTLIAFSSVDGNQLYVLIGRNVYSAAANFTADLERLAKPIFVGEPTSQSGNQWGDESYFILPYSGIMGAFPGVRWQSSHPWDKRHSVAPQIPVQLTAAAYFKGQDPVMDAIYELIKGKLN